MKEVRIQVKIGEEEEFFGGTIHGWERMTGRLIEARIPGDRNNFFSCLVLEQAEGDRVRMALVSPVSGCKIAQTDFSTYEEAMEGRDSFILRSLENHFSDIQGNVLKLNQYHAFRAAELYLTLGLPGEGKKKGDQAHE